MSSGYRCVCCTDCLGTTLTFKYLLKPGQSLYSSCAWAGTCEAVTALYGRLTLSAAAFTHPHHSVRPRKSVSWSPQLELRGAAGTFAPLDNTEPLGIRLLGGRSSGSPGSRLALPLPRIVIVKVGRLNQ